MRNSKDSALKTSHTPVDSLDIAILKAKLLDSEQKNKVYEQQIKEVTNTIDELKKQNFDNSPLIEPSLDYEEPTEYIPKANDAVDEEIAKFVNNQQLKIKFKRVSEGTYLFGLKKVHAKILNNRLVIRVGGGYTDIEKFIASHTEIELKKFERQEQKKKEEGSPQTKEVPYYKMVSKAINKDKATTHPVSELNVAGTLLKLEDVIEEGPHMSPGSKMESKKFSK